MHIQNQTSVRTPRFVVLGIGNTLMSDDGAGIHVIQNLKRSNAENSFEEGNIEVLDGGTLGYLLIDRLSDADGIVIVDSANLGSAAGTVCLIEGAGVDRYLNENPSSSVHEVGLIDLLQMMALNDSQPKLRALIGIQPELIDWGTEMSTAVAASIPAASNVVMNVLDKWMKAAKTCQD